ncbi:MAG: hypothetical protein K9N39_11930 [Candidatus Cloacimonetes bacterium]|nr:hypothetical protein [Candidatus Cloacimonadota bacterium]
MKKLFFLVICFVIWGLIGATVPQTINFQGAIQDENGQPVNDTQFMEFRIYDVPTGGSSLWSEQHMSVQISDGIFSVELGGTTPFPADLFDNAEMYVTFVFGGEEMSPRQQLRSVPYSLQSSAIDGVDLAGLVQQSDTGDVTVAGTVTADSFVGDGSGLTGVAAVPDSDWTIDGDNIYRMNGNVGIGTDFPAFKLSVTGDIFSDSKIMAGFGSTTEPSFCFSTGLEQTGISSPVGNTLSFLTNASERLRITMSGNVGIGTISPGSKLEVNGTVTATSFVGDGSTLTNVGDDLGDHTATQNIQLGNNWLSGDGDDEGIYIDNFFGQVGINEDFPLYTLHVSQDYDNNINPVAVFETTGTNSAGSIRFISDGNYYNLGIGAGGKFRISSVNDNIMMGDVFIINNDDYVGIGTTTPSSKLEVNGTVTADSFVGGGLDIIANDIGINASTSDTNNEWGVYTPDKIYGSNIATRNQSTYVRNVGSELLEPGDVVCIAGGFTENVLGENKVTANVEKADSENSSAILGVVEYKATIHEKADERNEGQSLKSFKYADGNAYNGDYISIIVFGPTEVKINSNDAIKSGDSLAAGNGFARKVRTTEINGITVAENVGTIGKALEDSNGKNKIKVFVNCK